ncbi:hypothetical protein OTU49_009989, partial [Cherax quadricarinatus]
MAEGGAQNVLCRYFINGACREGEWCSFSHNRDAARPSMVCRYYLRGTCFYGRTCRYDHIRPDNHSQSDSTQQEERRKNNPCPESTQNDRFDLRLREGVEETKTQSSHTNVLGVSIHAKEFIYNPPSDLPV